MTGKVIAQLGATIGRQFSYALLQAVAQLNERTLQEELHRLVEAEIVYQRGVSPQATYVFKHALIQDAAYESLLKSTRQHYHQRIALVLEVQFVETAEAQPELLAHHYTEAGLPAQAVPYWQHAAQRAVARSAHDEAIRHLTTGLALLTTLPETPERLQRDVHMHIALGESLSVTKGYAAAEVGQTYTYAWQRCARLDDPAQLFTVLRGLYIHYLVRAEHRTAQALGEQLLALAQHTQDPVMYPTAHSAVGATLLYLGEAAVALTHLRQGLALYEPQPQHASAFLSGDDAGVVCHSRAAWALWSLGYAEQGLTQNDEALALAQQLVDPLSRVWALSNAALFHQFRREVHFTQERAEASIHLATAQGFPYWIAHSAMVCGWVLVHQGQAQAGIAQIQQGLTAWRATGTDLLRPYYLALLAEAHGALGQPETGLGVLTEALALVDTTGERWYESECYRLKGELLLRQNTDNQAEAEACFHHALEIARSQQAKSFELRTATSLARLWQQQGKRQEAHALLAPVYGWFTEGFDTADLQEAQALLDALA
jgi:predicted ATPase